MSTSQSQTSDNGRKRTRFVDTSSSTQSRKAFNIEWERDFFWCLISEDTARCVICYSSTKTFTKHFLNNHYNKHRADYDVYIGENRKKVFEKLKKQMLDSFPEMEKVVLEREKSTSSSSSLDYGRLCTIASYKVAYKIARSGRSFTDASFIGNVMQTVMEDLCPSSVPAIKNLALSPGTMVSRISEMAHDLRLQFRQIKYDFYSIAIDESTDVGNVAQLAIFVRLWNKKDSSVFEDLLEVVPLNQQTRGEDIYTALVGVLQENNMPLQKMISLVTDGAPAMIGNIKGVGSRITAEARKTNPGFQLVTFHCLIHQQVLCSKTLNFEHVIDAIVKIVQYIRGSALVYRQFKKFLKDANIRQESIPYYTHTRWLSCCKLLVRYYTLRVEIHQFLEQQGVMGSYKVILDEKWQMDFAFFTDLAKHLHNLNLSLQGENKLVTELYAEINSFSDRLQDMADDLQVNEFGHFPLCGEYIRREGNGNASFSHYSQALQNLKDEFEGRFQDIHILETELQLFNDPFKYWSEGDKQGLSSELRKELESIHSSTDLKSYHCSQSLKEFYQALSYHNYPCFNNFAQKILTLFGSTYVCEQFFSTMKRLKTKERSQITEGNLKNALKVSATKKFIPDFEKLAQNKRSYIKSSRCLSSSQNNLEAEELSIWSDSD